ncbi:hypothetical protein F8388_017418, partial [Cannabis sativa]
STLKIKIRFSPSSSPFQTSTTHHPFLSLSLSVIVRPPSLPLSFSLLHSPPPNPLSLFSLSLSHSDISPFDWSLPAIHFACSVFELWPRRLQSRSAPPSSTPSSSWCGK